MVFVSQTGELSSEGVTKQAGQLSLLEAAPRQGAGGRADPESDHQLPAFYCHLHEAVTTVLFHCFKSLYPAVVCGSAVSSCRCATQTLALRNTVPECGLGTQVSVLGLPLTSCAVVGKLSRDSSLTCKIQTLTILSHSFCED